MFLAVDGIDGAGKTTLVRRLADLLAPLRPIITKEPTDDSPWSKRLRQATVDKRLTRQEEIEYFHKDRLHHLEMVVKPNLAVERPVITDRYVDSMLAFQAGSVKEAEILYKSVLPEILIPDITFILKCSVAIGLERIVRQRESLTTFEIPETLELAKAIYESRRGPNYAFINASGSAEATFEQAAAVLQSRFPDLDEKLRFVNSRVAQRA